jgi:predicted TPR repeat methyltransferase
MTQGRVHDGLLANSRAIALWPQQLQARDQVIRALLLLGERGRAAELYREWLAEDPDNPVVQHQLAACLGDTPPPRASEAYVQQVLMRSPPRSMPSSSGVPRPRAGGAGSARSCRRAEWHARRTDAGCGTGLCGSAQALGTAAGRL